MAYLTAREIVASQGISHRTLLRMIEARQIVPAQKLPARTGAYLFDPAEVERAFSARQTEPAEPAERISA